MNKLIVIFTRNTQPPKRHTRQKKIDEKKSECIDEKKKSVFFYHELARPLPIQTVTLFNARPRGVHLPIEDSLKPLGTAHTLRLSKDNLF